jgi:hypothetical protein
MNNSQPTIFVSIASYCDPMLPRTIDDCLLCARYPENIRFGICMQNDEDAPINVDRFRRDARFRFVDYDYPISQGGSWARAIAQKLWDGETYVLQIDSNMVFARGWDSSLVRMMRSFPADKPLITMNAPLFTVDRAGRCRKLVYPGIRATSMVDWGSHNGWSPWFSWGECNSEIPCRNRFISGNFIFTSGEWTDVVRQDPDYYYFGEKFALTVRSFTHGYDLFLPDETIAWHMCHPAGQLRRHWGRGDRVGEEKNSVAFDRLRRLIFSDDDGEQQSLGRYGLGSVRNRSDYERFAGMDLRNKRAHPDVYTGSCPDPVTIKSDADWARCITFEAYSNTDS